MKLLIIDSAKGAQTFIHSIRAIKHLDFNLVKLALPNFSKVNKQMLRRLYIKTVNV